MSTAYRITNPAYRITVVYASPANRMASAIAPNPLERFPSAATRFARAARPSAPVEPGWQRHWAGIQIIFA